MAICTYFRYSCLCSGLTVADDVCMCVFILLSLSVSIPLPPRPLCIVATHPCLPTTLPPSLPPYLPTHPLEVRPGQVRSGLGVCLSLTNISPDLLPNAIDTATLRFSRHTPEWWRALSSLLSRFSFLSLLFPIFLVLLFTLSSFPTLLVISTYISCLFSLLFPLLFPFSLSLRFIFFLHFSS